MNELRSICETFAHEIENAYENGELYDYLSENSYDIELRVTPERVLNSVQIMLAGGGPTIFLDTKRHGIVGYWGGDEAYYGVSYDISDEVDEFMAEIYNYER